jgi:hypothetical protein
MIKPLYLLLTLAMFSLPATAASYFKCKTKDGIVYSQFPCEEEGQEVQYNDNAPPPVKRSNAPKELSALDRVTSQQQIERLELQIKRTETRIRTYKRDKASRQIEIEAQLNRLMNDKERKQVQQQVKAQIKHLDAEYDFKIKNEEEKLKELSKELKDAENK